MKSEDNELDINEVAITLEVDSDVIGRKVILGLCCQKTLLESWMN